jgi:hypothetical protein
MPYRSSSPRSTGSDIHFIHVRSQHEDALPHGVDVPDDGNGVLQDSRLYQLVRQHDAVRERTLEITFLEPGAEAYVFTFG